MAGTAPPSSNASTAEHEGSSVSKVMSHKLQHDLRVSSPIAAFQPTEPPFNTYRDFDYLDLGIPFEAHYAVKPLKNYITKWELKHERLMRKFVYKLDSKEDLPKLDRSDHNLRSPLRKSRCIPGKLAGKLQIDAFGDTGAKYNFMDDNYATSQADLVINRNQTEQVVLGSGKIVTTTGTTKTTFQFPGEKEVYTQLFHLLPKCHHKVILGNRFLKMTKTFTDNLNHLRRVVTRTVSRLKVHDFLYIGGSGSTFKGLVNGDLQHALADTGAKLLMMDEDYARELGLTIKTGLQHRNRVLFADQTTAMTSGMVHGVSWQYGNDEGETHMLDFHILKNAPAKVVLSEDFLLGDDTNAFADYACYMVDDEEDDDVAGCFMIDIDYSYVNPAVDTREYRDQFESVRYGEEEDWIDSLSGDEKTAAQAAVQLRREQWDPTRPLTGGNAMNVVPAKFRRVSGFRKPGKKRFRLRLRVKKSTA